MHTTQFYIRRAIVFGVLFTIISWNEKPEITKAYIYGHKNSIVLASIVNATADQVAFTSFENTLDKGYWTYSGSPDATGSRTGSKCYSLSAGSIQRTDLLA